MKNKINQIKFDTEGEIAELINSERREWNDLIADTESELITERRENLLSNDNNQSIQSLNSKFAHNYSIDASLISKGNLEDSLRESIKLNVKSFKKFKANYSHREEERLIQSMNKVKIKTEKEKLIEYYQNLKSNSKMNLSIENSIVSERKNEPEYDNQYISNKIENIPVERNLKFNQANQNIQSFRNININSQREEDNNDTQSHQISSKDSEFVIFDCFKNMINMKKNLKEKSISGVNSYSPYRELHINRPLTPIHPVNQEIKKEGSDFFFYSQNNIHPNHNFQASMIKDLEEIETSRNINNYYVKAQPQNNIYQNVDHIETIETPHTQSSQPNILTSHKSSTVNNTSMKCINSHCIFYRKKYLSFKKAAQKFKKKYCRCKRRNEMLNMKIFYYENNKNSAQFSQSEKLNSTNVSTAKEEESKLTKMVYDKLQENYILFEKLENEILSKESVIEKQNETIRHQKRTIDRLLEHFNIFLAQGNYLINDLSLLKQNIYDKNMKDADKDCEEISQTITEYKNKIKEFSDGTKGILNISPKEEEIEELSISNFEEKDKNQRLFTIEEIGCNAEQNESNLSFSLSKSNAGLKNSLNTNLTVSNMDHNIDHNIDRSLKLLDLSHNTSTATNRNFNFNFHKEDKEMDDLFS